jgi:hypothetical protein
LGLFGRSGSLGASAPQRRENQLRLGFGQVGGEVTSTECAPKRSLISLQPVPVPMVVSAIGVGPGHIPPPAPKHASAVLPTAHCWPRSSIGISWIEIIRSTACVVFAIDCIRRLSCAGLSGWCKGASRLNKRLIMLVTRRSCECLDRSVAKWRRVSSRSSCGSNLALVFTLPALRPFFSLRTGFRRLLIKESHYRLWPKGTAAQYQGV